MKAAISGAFTEVIPVAEQRPGQTAAEGATTPPAPAPAVPDGSTAPSGADQPIFRPPAMQMIELGDSPVSAFSLDESPEKG